METRGKEEECSLGNINSKDFDCDVASGVMCI